jgi:hypothetical protein
MEDCVEVNREEPVPVRRKYHPADFGDQQWQRLLAYALERADRFRCATPYRYVAQDIDAAPLWPSSLEAFRSGLIDRHVSLIRWETVREVATDFLEFRLDGPERREILEYLREPRRLEDWNWNAGRPEDPGFSGRGIPILDTESADGRISVFASPVEVDQLSAAGIRLLEPLGVKAEPWPTP